MCTYVYTGADCCSAQWCSRWTGPVSSQYLPDPMLGKGTPGDAGIAVGWLGRTMVIIPSRNLVFVTLGSTWGAGQNCDNGKGYSEEFTAGAIWRMVESALSPSTTNRIPRHNQSPPPPSDPPCPSTPARPVDDEEQAYRGRGSCTNLSLSFSSLLGEWEVELAQESYWNTRIL